VLNPHDEDKMIGLEVTHPVTQGYIPAVTHPVTQGYIPAVTHPVTQGYIPPVTHPVTQGYISAVTHPVTHGLHSSSNTPSDTGLHSSSNTPSDTGLHSTSNTPSDTGLHSTSNTPSDTWLHSRRTESLASFLIQTTCPFALQTSQHIDTLLFQINLLTPLYKTNLGSCQPVLMMYKKYLMSLIMSLHTPHFSTTTSDITHTLGLPYVPPHTHTHILLFDTKISVWAGFLNL
jgi:hypothetical protein